MKPILVSRPRFWAKVRGYELSERFITYMSLNQDSKCDANCQGCFRYPERKFGLKNLLGMPDYVRLIEEFHRFGGLTIEISGEGEPFISHLTLPIVRMASQMGIWTTIFTNGHCLNESIIKELSNLKVALILSFHSFTKETYERDNGLPGSFEVKMSVIDLVSKMFENSDWKENGRVIKRIAIHWTLQANNLNEVKSARQFCDEKGFLFSIGQLSHTGHAAGKPELWLPEGQNLEELINLGDESILIYDEPDGHCVCGTCRYGLNIGADGNLLLDAHGGYEVKIANIRDISFEQAIRLQRNFSQNIFSQLDCFCPVRDPEWKNFLAEKKYL